MTLICFNEVFPHETSCGVIGEWEIDGFIKEFFEIFLWSLLGFSCASNDRNSCFRSDKLLSPFSHGLLDSCRIWRIRSLLFLSLLFSFLLCGPNFLALINIDNRWLILLSCDHYWCHQLFFLFLGWCILSINVGRTHIIDQRIGLSGTRSNYKSFTGTSGSIEQKWPDIL